MKVKDRYWEVENSIRFANPEKATRPLLCGPKVSEDGVRIRLWLRNLAEGTGAGGAIVLLSRHEAAVLANAINTRSNWIGEKTSDMPRIGVSVTETSTIIRFMECGGAGHIALPLADGERLASCLHDMADGCWRAHCGYVPEAVQDVLAAKWRKIGLTVEQVSVQDVRYGEAETKKIKAQGEADANAVLNESLTDNVLKQHYIDALSNADQLVVVPDGADTLVQTK